MILGISGEPIHTRCLAVAFTQAQGESIEFRADLLDLRKAGLMELAGRISSAGIIHKMELRGAFSSETGRLEHIEWDQSHVMHEANRSTKGECCRDPMVRLEGLVGTRLGEGFAAELKQCFGGPLGCTHVNTLFQELSAFVSRHRVVMTEHPELSGSRTTGERIARRSLYFDAFLQEAAATTEISVRVADLFFAARHEDGSERLLSHEEVRLVADVDLAGWQLRNVEAAERRREGPTCGEMPWQSRSEELSDFCGRSLGGGMTRFCLERLAGREEDVRLLSALLSLAPGMTQVGVALSDALVPSSATRSEGMPFKGPGPCYMLRTDGPLVETLFPRNPGGSDHELE